MTTTNKNFDRLSAAWNERCSKVAQGDKLQAESSKLYVEGNKLYAEGRKLFVEGRKLASQGNKLWDSTVARVLGPLNSQQIWLCDNTICLLTDGSLWKVPE